MALTSGRTRGTLGAMRKALELEMTAWPAAANFGSSSRAMAASMEAKMIFGRLIGGGRGVGLSRGDGHAGDAVGRGESKPPLGRFAIRFSAGPVAGREPDDLEPGVVFEQLDVALANHAGGPRMPMGYFLHSFEQFSVQEDGRAPENALAERGRSRSVKFCRSERLWPDGHGGVFPATVDHSRTCQRLTIPWMT